MKPATITETLQMVIAWRDGILKEFLSGKHITYHCAMMRISRLRRAHLEEYRQIVRKK